MAESSNTQAALHASSLRLLRVEHPTNPQHWQVFLQSIDDICCLNSNHFKRLSDGKAKSKLKHHYTMQAMTWLNYSYQAQDAIDLLNSFSSLNDKNRKFIAQRLRTLYGSSFIANAIEHGYLNTNQLIPSNISQSIQTKVLEQATKLQKATKQADSKD